jgi:nitroreductase
MEKSFVKNLKWRRAEKHFAPGPVDIKPIKDAIINAPSSYGMQPYHVYLILDQKLKEKLRPECYDQSQITDCHALFVFCVYKNLKERMDDYIKQTDGQEKRHDILEYLYSLPTKVGWAKQQAYIALGFGLAAATELKIASCPMEGFFPRKVAKILNIDTTKLEPCVLLTVGRHVSEGPIKEKDREAYFESIKEYKLEPRFRFKDIIELKK